jgi:hypothetical protein
MKKFLFALLIIAANAVAYSQLVSSFSPEHDKFQKELTQFMTATKNDNNIQALEQFQKLIKDGKIASDQIDLIIGNANVMGSRMMSSYPYFYNYLTAVINAAKSGKTPAQFAEWTAVVKQVCINQKKGDNSDFLKFIEFSNSFFQNNALSSTLAKTWQVESPNYKLTYEDDKPRVNVPATRLIGFTKTDTIIINQTSGDFYPLEQKWYGKSGRVDWKRASLDPNKVYCTFGNYTVSVNNFNFSVDSVTFYHTEYFTKPLIGSLVDKMSSSMDSNNVLYPRFESYDMNITIKEIAPNVAYSGGFSLWGNKVRGYGNTEVKAQLTFFARDGKTRVLSAKSNELSFKKGEQLDANRAEVSLYFGTDSIYHPQLNLIYRIQRREVRLLRGETGMGRSKFTDSYHNHEFETDAIMWNLDSSRLNLKVLSGIGQNPGIYESVNYFNKERIRQMQGYASYEPLSILKRLYEKNGTREINSLDVARAFDPNLKEGEIKSILYKLVENGFILYNEDQGFVTVKDKTLNYVLANAKKIDYDIIRIKSAPLDGTDFIDLKNSNIDLKGVKYVPISDTAGVSIFPKNNNISLQKDRNMEFDGLLYAGRMDMFGEKYKFQYAPFTVDLNKVDTMRINVPDGDKKDPYGNPILIPLRSRIEGLKGLLEVDAPINKSGRTRLPQFPRLYSREKSYIYYDDSTVAKGAYKRKEFFFEIDPFRLDSLNNFSPDIINWKGKFVSGGILPDIRDSIHIQGDGSLGFKSETPPGGYDLYKGKGKYYGKFELNYNGLAADGRIIHSTADFVSHDIKMYPDSLRSTTDSFTIAKTFDGVKTPAVKGLNDIVFWKPKSDSMLISMRDKDKPFAMYDDGQTTFKGDLLLTNNGLRGNGLLDWDEATLASRDFSFKTMNLSADTAALDIKSTGDKVTFKTPNVNAKVDFKTRIGDFVSNQKNIPTEFSYNQYTTAINEFKWFMDEKILDFKAPVDGKGEYFTSTKPEQKGLKFLGKRATYNLITSILRVEQVPEIRVADAAVVPDSGVVVIEGGAAMRQLKNAVILADTLQKYHRINKATVDIISINELKGSGQYMYTTKNVPAQIINFEDIHCKQETVGEKKDKQNIWKLVAAADIPINQNFQVYPNATFHGEVKLTSVIKNLNFKGYTKLGLTYPGVATSDFFINQEITPSELALKYDTTNNSSGNRVYAGIFINPGDITGPYSLVMAPKNDNKDVALFASGGIITDNKNGEYLFGNEKKIKGESFKGSVIAYDDKKGTIKAEGGCSLGTRFGIIKTKAAGTADVRLDSNTYKFNMTFGIDIRMDDKMQEKLEAYMTQDNVDLPDIDYANDKFKKILWNLSNEKDDKKMLEEYDKTGLFKRPKDLTHNFVFTDVNFVYDTGDVTLRSVGKIGVAFVGKKAIHKKLEGWMEFGYRNGMDVFSIYLKTGTNEWIYFEYRPGTLGILSSYDQIVSQIGITSPEKRKIKGENDRFYLYTIGSSINKTSFIEAMKDRANGIWRPREEPKFEELPPMDSAIMFIDSTNQDYLPGDEPRQAPMDNQERMLREMEQMRQSGEPLLSGPPPDRLKPKEEKPVEVPEPVKETPVETVPVKVEEPVKEVPVEPAPVKVEEPPVEAPKQEQTPPAEPSPEEAPKQ